MRCGLRIGFGWLVVACCGGLPAMGSDLSKFLHAVFEDQYDRAPSGAEMNYYTNTSRTEGPLEAYIRMVSTNDYFNNQCQRNAELYVTRLHQIFLHRDPRPDEVRFWENQLLQTGGVDRASFVRQFCQANNVYQVPSAPLPPSSPYRPGGAGSSAAETLVNKVELLRSLVQREMGGTRYGRALGDAVATLLSTTLVYRDTALSPQATAQQLQIAADNVERALESVQRQFRSVPAASSQTQNVLWEISQLVTADRPRPPVGPSVPADPLATRAEQLMRSVQQYATLLSSYQHLNPRYAALYRDVSGLYVQVESLRQLAGNAQYRIDVQRVVNSLLTQARAIASQLAGADTRLLQGWWNVQHDLDDLASAAGVGGDLYVTSDHPVLMNRPAWDGFPAQISPGYQGSFVNRQVVDLADQLVSEIDGYLQSLRPVAGRNREAARMIDATMDLRHDVLVVRQEAAAGAMGTRLQNASRSAIRQYRDVASQVFAAMVGQNATLNSPAWVRIGELTYEIDKTIGG